MGTTVTVRTGSLALILLTALMARGQTAADAVVKITVCMERNGDRQALSCGSGTVVQVRNGRSLILTCAHLWSDRYEQPDALCMTRKLVLDAPAPSKQAEAKVGVRLCLIDWRADLALVEVNAELPYSARVAPAGTHARHLTSCGYDQARLPGVRVAATPIGTYGGWTWTREIPVDGRSGGALLDADTGTVVGVCHGYESGPGGQRGQYVSLAAIREFLGRAVGDGARGAEIGTAPPQDPFALQYASPGQPRPACPPGRS